MKCMSRKLEGVLVHTLKPFFCALLAGRENLQE